MPEQNHPFRYLIIGIRLNAMLFILYSLVTLVPPIIAAVLRKENGGYGLSMEMDMLTIIIPTKMIAFIGIGMFADYTGRLLNDLQNHTLCMAGLVATLFIGIVMYPFSIGIIIGVWGIIVLRDLENKAKFSR